MTTVAQGRKSSEVTSSKTVKLPEKGEVKQKISRHYIIEYHIYNDGKGTIEYQFVDDYGNRLLPVTINEQEQADIDTENQKRSKEKKLELNDKEKQEITDKKKQDKIGEKKKVRIEKRNKAKYVYHESETKVYRITTDNEAPTLTNTVFKIDVLTTNKYGSNYADKLGGEKIYLMNVGKLPKYGDTIPKDGKNDRAAYNLYRIACPEGEIKFIFGMENGEKRPYANDVTMASMLGVLLSTGYKDLYWQGASNSDGSPKPSKSHINGMNFDFRYLRIDKFPYKVNLSLSGEEKDGVPLVGWKGFDIKRQNEFNEAAKLFGWAKLRGWAYWKFGDSATIWNTWHKKFAAWCTAPKKCEHIMDLSHVISDNIHKDHIHWEDYKLNEKDKPTITEMEYSNRNIVSGTPLMGEGGGPYMIK